MVKGCTQVVRQDRQPDAPMMGEGVDLLDRPVGVDHEGDGWW